MGKVLVFIFVSWVVCFVLGIGFHVNPVPLVAYCGLSLLAFLVYYLVLWIKSKNK